MTSQRVADRLVAWRAEKGYSQQDLAAELDVAVGTIYRWEKGALPLKRATIQRLEELTGITVPRRAEAPDLSARVAALEHAVSGLLDVLRVDEPAASRRLKVDAIAAALGVEEPRRGGRGARPPRSARGSS